MKEICRIYVKDGEDVLMIESDNIIFNEENGTHITYIQPTLKSMGFVEFCHRNRYDFRNDDCVIEIRVETSNIVKISYE